MFGRSRLGALAALALLSTACGDDGRPDGWTDATHGKNAKPAYDVVFPQGQVNRMDITVAPEDWQAMQDDMTGMLGTFGSRGSGPGGGGGGPGGALPVELTQACEGKAAGEACTATFQGNSFTSTCRQLQDGMLFCQPRGGGGGPGGGAPPDGGVPPDGGTAPGGGGPGGGGGGDLIPNTPVYVPSTVRFGDKTWWHVGVRFKGNSSLSQSWGSGVGKLPFRLHFDKFEDEYPEIDNQRFYGFQKLSLSNSVADASLIRDKVATDLFRESGVPASHTAFVALYVDHGEGAEYYGLYTLAEDPGDPLLNSFFGTDKGALYEADGVGARLQTFDAESFGPETDAAEEGWSSVEALISALNADRSDAAAWRANLEAKFDVDGFLKWLAIAAVAQHWDAYGAMTHNYYLYAHPGENGRVHWITWDHDRTLSGGGGGGGMGSVSLTRDEVTNAWPLIRYVLDEPTYRAAYQQYALEAARGPFAPEALKARFSAEHALIAPWVTGENAERQGFTFLTSPQQFQDALTGTSGLLQFAGQRAAQVEAAFGTP
ncbi:CotH kinase family protein [Stigmatella erecta]|uniref:CotH protein n=1 Tax=Stigmatella erecta TaxID=83460 RepID=A0A1I0ISC5_9BACT|nr:CotH kinase family protein [Stigmatella erecta]SET99343.1 CotH protein [Stigmatella erecta]